jgi:hypothetical protein
VGSRDLALIAVLPTIVAGCSTSGASSAPKIAAPAVSIGSRARFHVPAKPRLANSTASSDRVQPQPAPGSCHYRGGGLFVEPDPHCTPGAVDPAVTQANIEQTICRSGGYTESVRPAESVTEPEKKASMAAYSNTADSSTLEYDHLVPLEIGGAVNDPRNLWPEPNYPGVSRDSYVLNPKDRLEDRLHDLVCSGQLLLAKAQQMIARDWVRAYGRLVH